MSTTLTNLVMLDPDEAVSQFREAVASIPDAHVRDGLVQAFEERTSTPLAEQVRTIARESFGISEKIAQDTYRKAGIPGIAFEVVAKTFDGDHHDIEAVRAYGQEVGLVPDEQESNDE